MKSALEPPDGNNCNLKKGRESSGTGTPRPVAGEEIQGETGTAEQGRTGVEGGEAGGTKL